MKALRIITAIILFIVSANALAAGYSFMTDPSGAGLQIPLSWLQHSPFDNYFIPGITLFCAIGIFGLVAALFTVFQWNNYQALIVWQAIVLIGWIVIQIIMLQTFHFLHGVFLGTGLLLFMFGNRLNV